MKKVKPFKLLFQDEQALGMLASRLNGGFSRCCYPQSPVYLKGSNRVRYPSGGLFPERKVQCFWAEAKKH